ncbi:MAG TPA: hypothetical protein VK646_12715 [Actinomycetota bacterium]|nr:hypothetical protein [Actinomycetota bacterium]
MTPSIPIEPWAEVLTLGRARFGILVGGPFDGRCYPLPEGPVPAHLLVPGIGGPADPPTERYDLHEGRYRHRSAEDERPAA